MSMSLSSPSSLVSEEFPPSKEAAQTYIKCPEYYFDTGDVILQVENMHFRVHRFMLSRHSNVFQDMFMIGQKPGSNVEDEVVVDGCPVVTLSDKASEVKCILSIFYDNFKKNNWRGQMSVRYIFTLLRLGKKYEMDYLVKEALRRLRNDHPTTLELWEMRNGQASEILGLWLQPKLVEITELAHQNSIPSILPVAYLRYTLTYPLRRIMGEKDDEEDDEETDDHDGNDQDNPINLSPDSLRRCVLGRDHIMARVHKLFKNWRNDDDFLPAKGCTTKDVCPALQPKAIERFPLWEIYVDLVYGGNPFLPLNSKALSGFCPKCTKAIRLRYDEIRSGLWKDIPELFGLSKWDQLKDFNM